MLRTTIVLRYESIHDDLVMERLRAFLEKLEQDKLILTMRHKDVSTSAATD